MKFALKKLEKIDENNYFNKNNLIPLQYYSEKTRAA